MINRIHAWLLDHPEGASAEVLAREVLHLAKASPGQIDALLNRIPGREEYITIDEKGRWHARAPETRPSPVIEEARFAVVATQLLSTRPPLIGAVAVRTFVGGREADDTRTAYRSDPDDDECGAREIDTEGYLQDLAGVLEAISSADLVVIGDRREFWRLFQTDAARAGRMSTPQPLAITDLAKRVFKSTGRPSLERVAAELDLSIRAHGRLDDELKNVADLFHALLPRLREEGAITAADVRDFTLPNKKPVDFKKFHFDRSTLASLPAAPGVYVMRNEEGAVIYVGKSKNLRQRVGSYFLDAEGRPKKETRLLRTMRDLEIQPVGSELEALLLEYRLIRDEAPEVNKQIKVHTRALRKIAERNFILILPSSEATCTEVFLIREGHAHIQLRLPRTIGNSAQEWGIIRQLFYETAGECPGDLNEKERAELDLLFSWYARHRDGLNVVDVDKAGTFANLKRLIREHVRQAFDLEGGNATRL